MLPPIIPIHSRSCPSCISKWHPQCLMVLHVPVTWENVQTPYRQHLKSGLNLVLWCCTLLPIPSVYWSGLYQMHLTVMSHLFHAANNVTLLFPISHRKLNPKDPRFQASCASRTRLDEFFLQAHKAVSKRISNSLPILYTEVIDGGCGLMGPVSILCL